MAHGFLWLRLAGSLIAAHGLSCPAAFGILVLQPGIEPISPALEGEFFTTGPRGSPCVVFKSQFLLELDVSDGCTRLLRWP